MIDNVLQPIILNQGIGYSGGIGIDIIIFSGSGGRSVYLTLSVIGLRETLKIKYPFYQC